LWLDYIEANGTANIGRTLSAKQGFYEKIEIIQKYMQEAAGSQYVIPIGGWRLYFPTEAKKIN